LKEILKKNAVVLCKKRYLDRKKISFFCTRRAMRWRLRLHLTGWFLKTARFKLDVCRQSLLSPRDDRETGFHMRVLQLFRAIWGQFNRQCEKVTSITKISHVREKT
jgi:hypothetical protein